MKKLLSLLLIAALAASLAACGGFSGTVPDTTNEIITQTDVQTVSGAVTEQDTAAEETDGAFSLTSEDGAFVSEGNVYTITSAGTYAASGLLEGQLLVDAGEEDEVVIELSGAVITYGADSPIKILSAGNVDISAKKDTENQINDTRGTKTADDESQGEGAIYATSDLKIKGAGTLAVNGAYNNGIHTTKDLTIQNLSLTSSAYNNALKGNDSVTVTGGTVAAISMNGDGVKTENTDVSKNGVTRGDILLSGGSIFVYAAGDGFQAAHDFEMTANEEGGAPTVVIHTGSYSEYTASDAATSSYKGVKAQNELNIKDGSLTIQSYDDGLHADYGAAFGDGTTGQGTVKISGGTISMNVYAPENKTPGGRMGPGPGGWGGQQAVIGADGIHADNVLNISGGTIRIDSAYEGLEANVINVSGGNTVVSANDDGVNACKGSAAPLVNVTGGFLDVTVSPNGDTDGVDSNGSYTQTGGVVITRGPDSQMAAAIDAEGAVSVSGGTLIVLGYGRVSAGGGVRTVSLSLHSAGDHTVTVDGTRYSFTNASDYGATSCYSDASVSS